MIAELYRLQKYKILSEVINMGFIKTNHTIEEIGITIPKAYAQITSLSVDVNGKANAVFSIQQNREDILNKNHIDLIVYNCLVDKELPLYKQVYEKAKEEIFADWEDDIV